MEFAGCASNIYLSLSLLAKKCLAPKNFFVDTANHTKLQHRHTPCQKKIPTIKAKSFQLHQCPSDSYTAGIAVT